MKMQLEDLMDLYIGEDAAELGDRLPPLPEIGQTRRKPSAPIKRRSHIRSVLGLAASILIVLGVAGALVLGLGNGKSGGDRLAAGTTGSNLCTGWCGSDHRRSSTLPAENGFRRRSPCNL